MKHRSILYQLSLQFYLFHEEPHQQNQHRRSTPINPDDIYVSVSTGISQREDNDLFDDTYKRADEALYQSKKQNR
uniref:Diguanylate cyclase n=1 Tax=Vibrio algicola TaxID=2662262 RepID=A0A5Q0TJ01_9VIBR